MIRDCTLTERYEKNGTRCRKDIGGAVSTRKPSLSISLHGRTVFYLSDLYAQGSPNTPKEVAPLLYPYSGKGPYDGGVIVASVTASGKVDMTKPIDYSFSISENIADIAKVANYYSLPHPLSTAQIAKYKGRLADYSLQYGPMGLPYIPLQVRFAGNPLKPVRLFSLLYPKVYKAWDMYIGMEAVYNSGRLLENGISMRKENFSNKNFNPIVTISNIAAEMMYSVREGKDILYLRQDIREDILMAWDGLVIDQSTIVVDKRKFRSSGFMLDTLAVLPHKVESITEYPKVPNGILGWIGKSWFESDPTKVEYIFPIIDGIAELDALSKTFSLPMPCAIDDPDIANGPLPIRGTHYTVKGFNVDVPVAFGSVEFTKGKATKLILYKFKRKWEYPKLEIPDSTFTMIDRLLDPNTDIRT